MHVNDDPEQTADDGEQHRIGQLDAAGQGRHEADQREQARKTKYEKTNIHG